MTPAPLRTRTFTAALVSLIILSVVLAYLGFTAADNARMARADDPPSKSPRTKVAALGRLEPEDEVTEIGVPAGERIGKVLVVDGQKVKAGEALAHLRRHGQAVAERDLVAAQLLEAKDRLAAVSADGAANVHEAEAAVRDAEAGLRDAEEVEPRDIQVQEARVRVQELVLELAKRDQTTYEEMMKVDSGTKWKLDRQVLEVKRATEEVAVARTLLERITRAHDVSLAHARARLEIARAKCTCANTGVAVLTTQVPVLSLAESLKLAEEQLEETVLRAPRAGQVLKVLGHEGETSGKPLLKIGNTEQMFVVAEVYETDVGLVKAGQKAQITSPSLPKAVNGTVERVGRLIHKNDVLNLDPTAASDARVVEVRIRLEHDEASSALTNLQVDVTIETAR